MDGFKAQPGKRMPQSERLVFGDLTERVIGAAMEVHRHLGGGFLEKVYERAMCVELMAQGIPARPQDQIKVAYKGVSVGIYVADILIDDKVICEIKAVDGLTTIHEAQLLNYLKATGLRVGLLLNFSGASMTFRRLIR